MQVAIKKERYAAIVAILIALLVLAGCSSNANQTQTQSQSQSQTPPQSSESSQTSKQANDAVFSIDFPAEPTYESTERSGVVSETYTAKADDCYVLVSVDHVTLGLGDENPYDYAASITYSFLSSMINTSVDESGIEKGTLEGHPAGYITLDSQDGGSYVFASSILGDDYVLNLFVKADTQERLDQIMDSFSLKSSKDTNAGDFVAKDAGFSIAFPETPKYDSATGESYGYKYTNESWMEETSSGMYMVSCMTLPSDYPGFDNANAVNGGLSSTLMSLCSNFDVPTESAEIHFDEFLGCPSAYTTFDFEGYAFIGRAFIKDTKCYTVVAGTSKQEQSEAFINSFKFV